MCFPWVLTSRTVRPDRSAVASWGTRKSLAVSREPAKAPCMRRPASHTVSPSGM